MSLYRYLISLFQREDSLLDENGDVVDYRKIHTDLIYKSIWLDKYTLIDQGIVCENFQDLPLIESQDLSDYGIPDCFQDPYAVIDYLYELYDSSIETRVGQYKRTWFPARSADENDFDELVESRMYREEAKMLLECYIVLMSLTRKIPWEDDKKFYWKSNKHCKLVVFKQYVMKGSE